MASGCGALTTNATYSSNTAFLVPALPIPPSQTRKCSQMAACKTLRIFGGSKPYLQFAARPSFFNWNSDEKLRNKRPNCAGIQRFFKSLRSIEADTIIWKTSRAHETAVPRGAPWDVVSRTSS